MHACSYSHSLPVTVSLSRFEIQSLAKGPDAASQIDIAALQKEQAMLAARQEQLVQKLQALQLGQVPASVAASPSGSRASPPPSAAASSKGENDDDEEASVDMALQLDVDGEDQSLGLGVVHCPKTGKAAWIISGQQYLSIFFHVQSMWMFVVALVPLQPS